MAVGHELIPNLGESFDDNFMVERRIQMEEAIEKLLEAGGGVNLLLDYHLEHRVPEILIWVVGILLDGNDAAADRGRRRRAEEESGDGGGGGRGAVFVFERDAAVPVAGAGR